MSQVGHLSTGGSPVAAGGAGGNHRGLRQITGDFAHHPCQMAHPEWSSTADYDPLAAEATRHRLFAALAGEPVLMIGTHFAGPTAGHVLRDGKTYKLAVSG